MPEAKKDLTVMSFDYGTRRIGVAIGNTVTKAGQPIPVSYTHLTLPTNREV